MANAISYAEKSKQIINLKEYVNLRDIHSRAGLIGGKVILDGRIFSKKVFAKLYPPAVLRYKTINANSIQLPK